MLLKPCLLMNIFRFLVYVVRVFRLLSCHLCTVVYSTYSTFFQRLPSKVIQLFNTVLKHFLPYSMLYIVYILQVSNCFYLAFYIYLSPCRYISDSFSLYLSLPILLLSHLLFLSNPPYLSISPLSFSRSFSLPLFLSSLVSISPVIRSTHLVSLIRGAKMSSHSLPLSVSLSLCLSLSVSL